MTQEGSEIKETQLLDSKQETDLVKAFDFSVKPRKEEEDKDPLEAAEHLDIFTSVQKVAEVADDKLLASTNDDARPAEVNPVIKNVVESYEPSSAEKPKMKLMTADEEEPEAGSHTNDYLPQISNKSFEKKEQLVASEETFAEKKRQEEKQEIKQEIKKEGTQEEKKPEVRHEKELEEPVFISEGPKTDFSDDEANHNESIIEVKITKETSNSLNNYQPSLSSHNELDAPKVSVHFNAGSNPVMYTIRINTSNGDVSVDRSFSDFQTLHNILEEKMYYHVLPVLPTSNWKLKIHLNPTELLQRSNTFKMYIERCLKIPEIETFELFQAFILFTDKWKAISSVKNSPFFNFIGTAQHEISNIRKLWNQSKIPIGGFEEQTKETEKQETFLQKISDHITKFSNSITEAQKAAKESAETANMLKVMNGDIGVSNSESKASTQGLTNFLTLLEEFKYDVLCCREALNRKAMDYFKLLELKRDLKPNLEVSPQLEAMKIREQTYELKLTENLTTYLNRNNEKMLKSVKDLLSPALGELLKQ